LTTDQQTPEPVSTGLLDQLQFGTVPDWIAAIGTVIALGAAVWAIRLQSQQLEAQGEELKAQREELELQRHEVARGIEVQERIAQLDVIRMAADASSPLLAEVEKIAIGVVVLPDEPPEGRFGLSVANHSSLTAKDVRLISFGADSDLLLRSNVQLGYSVLSPEGTLRAIVNRVFDNVEPRSEADCTVEDPALPLLQRHVFLISVEGQDFIRMSSVDGSGRELTVSSLGTLASVIEAVNNGPQKRWFVFEGD